MAPFGLIRRVTDEEAWSEPSKSPSPQGYAELITSDDEYLVFRRFGALSTRVILELQNDLIRAESELRALDEKCHVSGDTSPKSLEKDDRVILLSEIKSKLKEYSWCPRSEDEAWCDII
jgi:hypothetical protein